MREILIVELKIPFRYDLGWEEEEIESKRIEWLKSCIEDTAALEAIFTKAEHAVGEDEIYNIRLK